MSHETYILYKSEEDDSFTFFRKGDFSWMKELPKDAREVWSVEAQSFDIAQLKKHEYLGWEPYKPMIANDSDLLKYLPREKFDVENAALLRNLGYPAVKPIMSQLLEWLQDMNWPVAQFLAPWIVSIGVELYPYIQEIFESSDGLWKYWLLTAIIDEMPLEVARSFSPLLEKISQSTLQFDTAEGVPDIAKEILTKIKIA